MSRLAREGVDWIEDLGQHGDAEALLMNGESFDYSRLREMARCLAAALGERGLVAGDLVAVLAAPSVAGVALIHALLDRRIAMLPLNGRLTEVEQVDLLERARPRFLIVSENVDPERADRLAVQVGCGLILLASGSDRSVALSVRRSRPPGVEAFETGAIEDRRVRDQMDVALILSTSGTSGRPKLAMLSRDNLQTSARASIDLLGHQREDRWLLCMPLFHIGGLSVLIRSALVGTSAVIHENFDPRRVADCLEADRITRVSFVATMLEQVIVARGEKRCPATLRLVLLGGGPASTSLLQRAEALGYPIAPTYGLTEAASQVATRPPLDPFDPLVPDGRDRNGGLVPLPGVGLRILDENGNLASVGEEGEILVRGPIVMQGYFDEPTATAAAIVDGWLRTGDIGRIDASGHLRVLDRRADLILSGGENVYPAEIESVIAGHPDVEGVGVVGRPDERFGARPVAYVIWRGAEPFDDKRLESFCRERLAGYKIPIEFHETPRLPRTTSGKLIRRLLE